MNSHLPHITLTTRYNPDETNMFVKKLKKAKKGVKRMDKKRINCLKRGIKKSATTL